MVHNCRGAGAPKTLTHLIDLIQQHRLHVMTLLETRVHNEKVKYILDKSNFTDITAVEVCGFAAAGGYFGNEM